MSNVRVELATLVDGTVPVEQLPSDIGGSVTEGAPTSGFTNGVVIGTDPSTGDLIDGPTLSSVASGVSPSHTEAAGQSSAVRGGAGHVRVVDEALNIVAGNSSFPNGFITPFGDAADQSAGVQSFVDAIANASGGQGGRGVIPECVVHMGDTQVTYPDKACLIHGSTIVGTGGNADSGIGGSVLVWDTDVSGAPHTTYGVTLGGGSVPHGLQGVTLQLPARFSKQVGGMQCVLGGINAKSGAQLSDLAIIGGSTGIGWGGPGASYDHTNTRRLYIDSGYAFNFLPGSNGSGDFHVEHCPVLKGSLAAIGVAQSASSGLTGSTWLGCGAYGPIGIHRYSDGSGGTSALMITVNLLGLSMEGAVHASIYDELWRDGTHGQYVTGCVFLWGMGSSAPASSGGWSSLFGVISSSGDTITVNDGTGRYLTPGMTVVGSGVPADTEIVSIAGTWPWATPVITLNNAVTSPTAVTISQPYLASIVALGVEDNEFLGQLAGNPSSPLFAVGQQALDNKVSDGRSCLAAAANGPLIVGPANAPISAGGNTFGSAGDTSTILIGSGPPPGEAVHRGDLMATGDTSSPTSGGNFLRLCDGTHKPVGVALRADAGTHTQGNMDYLICGGGASDVSVPVFNRSGSDIAAHVLLYADATNRGGVTATKPSTGWTAPIGLNGASVITNGTAGVADELYL